MNKYICIHGHFYQPPRENPWLEEIIIQDSAYPYHDWNEKISAECYAPNASSRILNPNRKIIDIVNNYSKISFNFGPTLLSWLENHDNETYQLILDGDKIAQKQFGGHGTAIAQIYNHVILPLSNSRDKETQIVWGIKDFKYHFGRNPEGMWAAQTAIDLESMDLMAKHGIKFTILHPSQAKQVRALSNNENEEWFDVSPSNIDTRCSYLVKLPSGREIAVFFYQTELSREIGRGKILLNGQNIAQSLLRCFDEHSDQPQLSHIATNGEFYGHHHKHGDMALAYCLYSIEEKNHAQLTCYGEFLEISPPQYEVEIFENSSCNCIHGVERWRDDCGCNSGKNKGWHQKWRAPLRGALDWLRDNLIHVFEQKAGPYLDDPWEARNHYIDVLLNRSKENVDIFFDKFSKSGQLSSDEISYLLELFEIQRNAMLMYSSCGWFHDEISDSEGVQLLQYAARSMQLATDIKGPSLEETFLSLLERTPSNIPHLDGREIYQRFVAPDIIGIKRTAAHFAIASLFYKYQEKDVIEDNTFLVNIDTYNIIEAGKQKLAYGKLELFSKITFRKDTLLFTVLGLGDHNFCCGIKNLNELNEQSELSNHPEIGSDYQNDQEDDSPKSIDEIEDEIIDTFNNGDLSKIVTLIDSNYGNQTYSLWHLFKNEQRNLMDMLLSDSKAEMGMISQQIIEHHYPIMQVSEGLNIPVPDYFKDILKFNVNFKMIALFNDEELDFDEFDRLVDEIKKWNINIDRARIELNASRCIDNLALALEQNMESEDLLIQLIRLIDGLSELSLELNIWKTQNTYFRISNTYLKELEKQSDNCLPKDLQWLELFETLGEKIKIKVE